jgi:galactose mutarotase-like enzyme
MAEDAPRLMSRLANPGEVRPGSEASVSREDGHVELVLRHMGPSRSAAFLVDCGMLCTELGDDSGAYLARPRGIDEYAEGAATAMPLLHPYANRLARDEFDAYGVHFDVRDAPRDRHGLPIHGTMHGRPFELDEIGATDRRAAAVTSAEYDAPELLRAFPFPHTIRVMPTLDASTLRVTTQVDNRGERPMPVSFGWHPFFTLPTRPRDDWILRMPACRRHVLDEHLIPTGETVEQRADRSPIGDRVYDDHFDLGADRRFELGHENRTLTIEFGEQYSHAQIYLPGPDWPLTGDFVCIEPMVANTNALVTQTAPTVAPGETFTATFRITVP